MVENERTFYTSTKQFEKIFDATSRQMGYKARTLSEFERWKSNLRRRLREITGIETMEPVDPEPRRVSVEEMKGYRREKIVISTEKEVRMPFYMLIPADLQPGESRPAMIATHGHGSGGKFAPAGRSDIPEVKKAIESYNYTYGIDFVRQGFITFCPDARGFGERREWMNQSDQEEGLLKSSCIPLNHMAISLGRSLTGLWVWDLMRLVDYISAHPLCRGKKIGCGGLSGGGLQSLWLAALDERIDRAVVSGYFYGYKDSLLKLSNNCGCNYVPCLWETADMGDVGALIAPRPLFIESGERDHLNGERGLENVTEQLEITRAAYRLCNAEERLHHHIFSGEHRWDGAGTSDFLQDLF